MPTQDRSEPGWRGIALPWAARRCGALEALATSSGTPEDIAEATGVDEDAAERLVAALESEGFLARVGDEYEPTNRLLGFLTKTDLRSIGRLPAELDAFDRWVALPGTVAGKAPPEPPDALRNRLGREAAADETRVRSEVTTAVYAAPDGERVVVVGDGPGRRAVEFHERGWDVTLLDSEARIDAVEPLLRREAVELRGGDPTDLPDCDLAVFVGTLSERDADGARAVVEAAGRASPAAVFLDAFHGETDGAALADVDRLATGAGRVHDAETVRSWVADSFGDAAMEPVPGSPMSAAVGRAIQ
ncbi:SAM-dependent methyltransferase [Natronomonas salina]|uniref:SAM-dependent methyltransferase n=1 Tax=Natronomonas salina TaxID=1710540 RepID=UPI0015B667B0|nr:SAM-dependent methyltransferase [Natronomonas salina]QLD89260.1 SAM-dependent methyltransferase [Natronomonas salina]